MSTINIVFQIIAIIFLAIIILLLLSKFFGKSRSLPGPWNLPIIGFLHKLDQRAPYLTLTKLVEKYGPVYEIKLGLLNVAVIADGKVLKKILMKNETIPRPPLYLLKTLFDNKGLVCASTDVWKEDRKFLIHFLKTVGATKFSPNRKICEALITNHAEKFVENLKSCPNHLPLDPSEFVNFYISSITHALLLGKEVAPGDTTATDLTSNLKEMLKLMAFGGPLNFLPILRFLPHFKKALSGVQKGNQRVHAIQTKVIREREEKFSTINNSPSNLIDAFLLQKSSGGPEHIYNSEELNYLLLEVSIALTQSASTSLLWIFLYLAQYEEVQNKVRQELCDVLQGKKIKVDDFANLHYTKATVAEVARIRTLVPLGVPRCASENICVEGFTIRKGTMIMPLLWAIHMDPKVFEQPEEFRPERFLDKCGQYFKPEVFLPFQIGKRMCIGPDVTEMIILILTAHVLESFTIKRAESVAIDFDGICGVALCPKPQKIIFSEI